MRPVAIVLAALLIHLFANSQTASTGTLLIDYPRGFYTIESTTATGLIFYTGRTLTGTNSCGTLGPSEFCDSCAALTSSADRAKPCNYTEVHSNLDFTVVIETSATAANFSAVSRVVGFLGSTLVTPSSTDLNGLPPTPSKRITVTFKWGDICAAASSGNQNCAVSFRETFRVGIDKDNTSASTLSESAQVTLSHRYVAAETIAEWDCPATAPDSAGFCYFTTYPGDSKVYINPKIVVASADVPDATSSVVSTSTDRSKQKYAAVRIFALATAGPEVAPSVADFQNLVPDGPSADLKFDISTGKFPENKVKGLVNGQPYVFGMASVDQGGNMTFFLDPTTPVPFTAANADINPNNYGTTQAAVPQKVSGLLDGQKCFIATAAYGSVMDQHVDILRQFRSQVLLKSDWGKSIVRWYYQNSPPMAHWLVQHSEMKIFVRAVLWPLVVLSQLSLHIGFWWTLFLIVLLSASLPTYFVLRKFSREKASVTRKSLDVFIK